MTHATQLKPAPFRTVDTPITGDPELVELLENVTIEQMAERLLHFDAVRSTVPVNVSANEWLGLLVDGYDLTVAIRDGWRVEVTGPCGTTRKTFVLTGPEFADGSIRMIETLTTGAV